MQINIQLIFLFREK